MQEKKRFLASTFPAYIPAMLRRLALSYWTPIAAGLVLLGLHLAWAVWWEPAKRGEITTGFGASLIVLGILVAARPFLRSGVAATVARGMPRQSGVFPRAARTQEQMVAEQAQRKAERGEVRRDVLAERVIAVAVIGIGTLLNGYGAPLVRLLRWEVQP